MQKIINFLDDELYTRPQVASYTVKSFENIINSVDFDAVSLEEIPTLLQSLQEHSKRISFSPVALFLTIFFKIRLKIDYMQEVNTLFQTFIQGKKQNIALFCAREFLKKDESKFLLTKLANFLEKIDTISSQEELQDIYEKILQKSPTNPEILYKLAFINKKLNKSVESLLYYKAAFSNMLNSGEFQKEIFEIWNIFFELQETDFDFFLRSIKSLSKSLSEEKFELAFKGLYNYITQRPFSQEQKIILVKEMVHRNFPKGWDFRSILIDLYKKMYQSNTLLQTFMEISSLAKQNDSLQLCIDKFESLIQFDVGAYVFHNSFGYGQIREIVISSKEKTSADFRIDFQKKQNHLMSLRIATTSLSVFQQEDFFIQKIFEKSKLTSLLKTDLHEFMKIIFGSSKNGLTLTQIKNLTCPEIISIQNWTSESKKIQQYLKDSPQMMYRSKTYFWQSGKQDQKDILLQRIQKEKLFEEKLSLIEMFSTLYRITEKERDIFQKLLAYEKDLSCCSLFRIVKIKEKLSLQDSFMEREILSKSSWLDEQVQEATLKFLGINRIQFLHSISIPPTKEKLEQLVRLFYKNCEENFQVSISFLESIFSLWNKEKNFVIQSEEFVSKIYENFLQKPDAFLSICKFFTEKSHQFNFKISLSDVMVRLVEVLGVLYKEMEFSGRSSKAKKQYGIAFSMLFDQERLISFLHSEESKVVRIPIIKLLEQFHFLDNYIKVEIKKLAIEFSI